MDGEATNTDREVWRSPEDHRLFITEGGGVGMNVGGRCVVMPMHHWMAKVPPPNPMPGQPGPMEPPNQDGLRTENDQLRMAIRWALGEAPDADGKWFGEHMPEQKVGKRHRPWWWRKPLRQLAGMSGTAARKLCTGCDGHECDRSCQYPGIASALPMQQKG